MAQILESLDPQDVIAAIVANLVSYWLNYGRTPQGVVYNESDAAWFRTIVPTPLYNGVLRSQFTSDSMAASIQQIVQPFAENQLPFVWWTQTSTLETALEAQGFTRLMELPGMAIDLHTLGNLPPLSQLEILTVEHSDTLKPWVEIAMAGFSTPPELFDPLFALESALNTGERLYRRYLAVWQGTPVAIAALYLDAGVAGIYFVATKPEARRQGFGMAVVQAALQEAKHLGYRLAILQASPMGTPLYAQMGFQEYCQFGLYLWTPSDGSAVFSSQS